ncbi:MAG: discoidin domain-containing protein [Bacteroidota bacterium]
MKAFKKLTRTFAFILLLTMSYSCTQEEDINPSNDADSEEPIDEDTSDMDDTDDSSSTDSSLEMMNASVTNDVTALNERVTVSNQEVKITAMGARGGRVTKNISLKLIGEVASPKVNGADVMATSVSNINHKIAVSYNTAGATYSGAAVLMSLQNDELIIDSQITFEESDVSHALLTNGFLYLAGASALSDQPAWTAKLPVNGNTILTEGIQQNFLGGFVATSIATDNKEVFVTTGAGVSFGSGLYQLDASDFTETHYTAMEDLRWVHHDHGKVIVQNASPSEAIVFENGQESFRFEYAAPTKESKASFDLIGDYVFLASGQNGVQIHEKETGTLVGDISLPSGSATDLNTNSVAVYGDLIFISNGQGVYIATYSEEGSLMPEIIGRLELGDFASVNHVVFVDNKLIIASGLGGVKVIALEIQGVPPVISGGQILDKSDWEVVQTNVDSKNENHDADRLIDGNLNTFWYCDDAHLATTFPYEVEIDLGAEYWVTEFRYLARQDFPTMYDGAIKDFKLYLSEDGDDWGVPIYEGALVKTKDKQIIAFEYESVKGRYLKLVALSEVNGMSDVSGAEIDLAGTPVD